jgi:biopolymer transport protein TolR
MAFSDQREGGAISEINVTPLVDVMLVLLVIFMVTAPIIQQQGVAIDLPRVQGGALPSEQRHLVVSVAADGRVYVDDDAYEEAALATRLDAIAAERPGEQVYVRADASVPYGRVMETLGALRDAGLTKVGLVTQPPEPSQ